jgi:hypothetical protein
MGPAIRQDRILRIAMFAHGPELISPEQKNVNVILAQE